MVQVRTTSMKAHLIDGGYRSRNKIQDAIVGNHNSVGKLEGKNKL